LNKEQDLCICGICDVKISLQWKVIFYYLLFTDKRAVYST